MASFASATITVTAVATTAFLICLHQFLYPHKTKTIASPRRTVLPYLSANEKAQLDYGPDAFPGARDVETPYGSIRVYEFGPTTGRKVLLLHGISTSCQTLGPIARGLVDQAGCRVMLFDFFGRGFSDGVGDLPHDARLYTSQILLALASSPLPWSGHASFDLLGYSMGGGIAVHFAAAFSSMLRSLVLLAPAGLIRPQRFGTAARIIFTSGIVPERLLAAIMRRRLQQPISNSASARSNNTSKDGKKKSKTASNKVQTVEHVVQNAIHHAVHEVVSPIDDAVAEVSDSQVAPADTQDETKERDSDDDNYDDAIKTPPPERDGYALSLQVMRYVRWMLSHHEGFVPAVMSCVRDAPLMEQHAAWQTLTIHMKEDSLPLCMILGRHDTVVSALEYEEDVLPLLGGRDAVSWNTVPGGHEFPMTYSRQVLRAIYRFWDTTGVPMGDSLAMLETAEDVERAETATHG